MVSENANPMAVPLTRSTARQAILFGLTSIESCSAKKSINWESSIIAILKSARLIPAAKSFCAIDSCTIRVGILGGITTSGMSHFGDANIILDMYE